MSKKLSPDAIREAIPPVVDKFVMQFTGEGFDRVFAEGEARRKNKTVSSDLDGADTEKVEKVAGAIRSDSTPRERGGGTEAQRLSAKELTLRLNKSLKHFIAVDEDVWKASLWRTIGVTRIPFGSHRRTLGEIASELDELTAAAQSREVQTYAIVAAYADRLRTAVLLLEAICARLELKAQRKKGPGWAEYSALVNQFAEAKNAYIALGPDLNRFARDAIMIDRRERGQSGASA